MSAPAIRLHPRTFAPLANGHLDVIARACRLVGRVTVGVALSAGRGARFGNSERCKRVRKETAAIAEPTGKQGEPQP